MSRFLLLFLFLLWFAWPPGDPARPGALRWELVLFLGGYALLVGAMGFWSRYLARRISGRNLHPSLRRFNKMMTFARIAIPVWFAVGVFLLDWGRVVRHLLGPVADWPAQLPAAVVALVPPVLAWMGLWWSQFPADQALRKQSLMIQLDDGAPIHAPPSFWAYMRSNLRLQLLFTAVPILLILLVHDLIVGTLWRAGVIAAADEGVQAMISLGSALLVFLFAPEILRRVLHTQPLPDSALRRRLERMCERFGLQYRQILLWRTGGTMGNAAVMGLIPQVRYILLSDLLLETMTDEQIEAVFAHEVGHVVHRHMGWYVIFFVGLLLLSAGPGEWAGSRLLDMGPPDWLPVDLVLTAAAIGVFFVAFGYISRRFERQADVFAARTVQGSGFGVRGSGQEARSREPEASRNRELAVQSAIGNRQSAISYVGPYGAHVLSSALHRVAVINNIPVAARSWCHGSIAKRMRYLREISADPIHTRRFDQFMARLYAGLLAFLAAGAVWLLMANWSSSPS